MGNEPNGYSQSVFTPTNNDTLVAVMFKSSSGAGTGIDYFQSLVTNDQTLQGDLNAFSESVSQSFHDLSSSIEETLIELTQSLAEAQLDATTALLSSSLTLPAAPSGKGLFAGADYLGFYSSSNDSNADQWWSFISGTGQFRFAHTGSLDGYEPTQ